MKENMPDSYAQRGSQVKEIINAGWWRNIAYG